MTANADAEPRGLLGGHRPSLLVSIALGILVLLSLCGLFAGILAPYDYTDQFLRNRFAPPVWMGGDWSHSFGTDALGRDILSRLLYGLRISLGVALLGVLSQNFPLSEVGLSLDTIMLRVQQCPGKRIAPLFRSGLYGPCGKLQSL